MLSSALPIFCLELCHSRDGPPPPTILAAKYSSTLPCLHTWDTAALSTNHRRTQTDCGCRTEAQERLHISENQSHMTSSLDTSFCCHWTSWAVIELFSLLATPSMRIYDFSEVFKTWFPVILNTHFLFAVCLAHICQHVAFHSCPAIFFTWWVFSLTFA